MGILHRTGVAAAICGAITVGLAQGALACTSDVVSLRGGFGAVDFRVELALTPDERAQGLMFREELARFSGMLFVFDQVQPLAFWMRNTLIPLDMIFVDSAGRVISIEAMAEPLSEVTRAATAPGLAVLEINGGMSAMLGIKAGAELRHPALPQEGAAWPCDETQ